MKLAGLEPLFRRLRARFRPPRTLKVTPAGRIYLLMTLGVGLGALNTGNNLLYLVLGLQLSSIVLSGILSEATLKGVQVRRLGAEASFAQEGFAWRWAVRRDAGRSFALVLSEAQTSLRAEQGLAVLEPGQEVVVRAEAFAERRGPVQLSAVRVTTTFPLGLFAKSRLVDLPGTQLIYPRRLRTGHAMPPPDRGPLGAEGNPRRADGDGEVLSLRDLAEGEDVRRVHWMKSASAGHLLRVEREREERRSYALKVPAGLAGAALEEACERVAALAHRLLGDGHEVGLETPEHQLRPAAGLRQEARLLQALASTGFAEVPALEAEGAEAAP